MKLMLHSADGVAVLIGLLRDGDEATRLDLLSLLARPGEEMAFDKAGWTPVLLGLLRTGPDAVRFKVLALLVRPATGLDFDKASWTVVLIDLLRNGRPHIDNDRRAALLPQLIQFIDRYARHAQFP